MITANHFLGGAAIASSLALGGIAAHEAIVKDAPVRQTISTASQAVGIAGLGVYTLAPSTSRLSLPALGVATLGFAGYMAAQLVGR